MKKKYDNQIEKSILEVLIFLYDYKIIKEK